MFSNLIESGSHAADLRRKGRFFLGTVVFYGLLLVATGVGSIYAYNTAFLFTQEGRAMAMVVLLLAAVLVLAGIAIRLVRLGPGTR